MISISKSLRSAAIVAAATLTLAATGALAQNLSTTRPAHSSESKSSTAPNTEHSPEVTTSSATSTEPTEKPDVETTEAAKTDKTDPDHHGDCVSKIARDHTQTEANKDGKQSHGAWVSDWAHSCPNPPKT
jgi:hypothetical protein